jgi:hypothetical protein
MAINSGTRFWNNVTDKPFDQFEMPPETRQLVREAMFFEPVPTLRRVVFIATPHRGSYQATDWILDLFRRFITLPATLVVTIPGPVTRTDVRSSGNQAIADLGGQYEPRASVR